MPYRVAFDCLWCGTSHRTRGSDDLEGWSQLCPACLGRAGDNGFLRMRLHAAMTERARAHGRDPAAVPPGATGGEPSSGPRGSDR